MTFKEDVIEDLDEFFDVETFAIDVSVLLQGEQNQIVIPAIVDYLGNLDEIGRTKLQRAKIQIRKDNISTLKNFDSIWIDGERWKVYQEIEGDTETLQAIIIKDKRAIT